MQCKGRIGNYRLLNTLGQGSTSTVFYAEHVIIKEIVALKLIDKSHLEKEWKADPRILRLTHPNIIKIHEFFETDEFVVMVMRCASSTTLADRLEKAPIDIVDVKKIIKQLLLALDYLAERNVVHRDIKADNILIDEYNRVTLGDFGMAKNVSVGVMNQTACGTPIYVAPEVIKRESYDCKVDIWSLGVLLYRMVFGMFPFMNVNLMELMRDIAEKEVVIRDDCDKCLVDLLKRMLDKDPERRVSAREALNHDWFCDCQVVEERTDESFNKEIFDTLVREYKVDKDQLARSISEGARDEYDGMYQILMTEKNDRLLVRHTLQKRCTWGVNTFTSIMRNRNMMGPTGYPLFKAHKRVVSLVQNGRARPFIRA